MQQDPRLRDFRNFLYAVWVHIRIENKRRPDGIAVPTEVQYDIASYLQYGPSRCVIEAFRGVGKSWITSAFCLWLLYWDQRLNILVVSASKQRADEFTTFTLRLIREMPILQHLAPGPGQRDSKIAFDVCGAPPSHAPSIKSVGVMGQMAGSRADVIIADDIEIPNNSDTVVKREKLSEVVKEFDAVLKPNGRVIYLGTPQTEQSLYNEMPGRGYETRIWPARYPQPSHLKAYGDSIAPLILSRLEADPSLATGGSFNGAYGQPTDPERFPEEDLQQRELSFGRSGFELQFMLNTALSDAERYPLKLSDLIVMALNPELGPERPVWAASPELRLNDLPSVGFRGDYYYGPMAIQGDWIPYQGVAMTIDPAGRGSDEIGYAVVAQLNGFLYVLANGGLRGGYTDENLIRLCEIAKNNKVNILVIEDNFGDGMFTKLLTPHLSRIYPCSVEEVKHTNQKELRIIGALEPVMNQHRLVVAAKVVADDLCNDPAVAPDHALGYRLFHQMTRITKDKGCLAHDDRLEALAMAVRYWTDALAIDSQNAIEDRQKLLFDRELDRFMAGIGASRSPRQNNWLRSFCGE